MSEPATPPSTPMESWEVLDLLTSLVQKSLVVYEEDDQGRGRYRLLEPMRQYARDRLLEAGEGEAVRERHGECFLQLAEAARAAVGEGKGDEALERLEGEHDNLRAALAWTEGHGRSEGAAWMLRLAGALGVFWYDRGYWDEGRQWLERALAGTPAAEPSVERARALAAVGRLAAGHPDYPTGRNWLEEGVALFRAVGDTRGRVEALTHLAELLWARCGNHAGARVLAEEAVALARALGDPRLLAMALSELGMVLRFQAPQTARKLVEESLAPARQVGDGGLVSKSLQRLGLLAREQGDWTGAQKLLEESVAMARAAKNKSFLFWTLGGLADVLSQQGDPERAKSLRAERLLLARELRTPHLVGWAIRSLTEHDLAYDEALRVVEQAAAEYGREVVRFALAGLVVRAPSYEEALERIDRAAREYGPQATHSPLVALGHAARERGDYEQAATCYRRCMALRQEAGDTFAIAQCLEDFAGLAARQQQWERAARLLGAAEGACRELERTLPVAVPEEYKRAVEGAHAALGEEAFAAAWAAGRAMTLDQAISNALEGVTLPSV